MDTVRSQIKMQITDDRKKRGKFAQKNNQMKM